jgi:putative copper resistance protein D
MKRRSCAFVLLLLVIGSSACLLDVSAQQPLGQPEGSNETDAALDPHAAHRDGLWEGSAQGIAYSEFNHRFAGLMNLLFGLFELGHALRYPLPVWTRLILPGAFGVIGVFLLVWSDHEAWPIGSLGFVDTFFGQDQEIIQHKLYGIFAATVALSETARRMGWARHPAWAAPLVVPGFVGALALFAHSHGNHPANETIELHHALLGILGIGAMLSKGMASWMPGASTHPVRGWELAWAVFVILMGLQLIVYFE